MTVADTSLVTRTCQDPFTVARLVGVLEQAWTAIRTHHPDVPNVVIVVGSGSPAKASQALRFGHFADLRWQTGTTRLPEVLVSGEGLQREPEQVFTTLLHEATHGLACTRNVKDTSRQGRWHNKQFATLAAELGMTTTKDDKLGYSPCTLTDLTRTRYQPVISDLAAALGAYRHPEHLTGNGRSSNNNGASLECECPRKVRVSLAVYEAAPIWCPSCGEFFIRADDIRDEYNRDNPLPAAGQHPIPAATGPEAEDDPMVFYDPTGATYGIPTYPYRFAPTGLATVRQLRAQGLRRGTQPVAAQILWRRGKRCAYLYRLDLAQPKRPATPAQLAALQRAMTARRTCSTCGATKDYCIPRSLGECLDCAPPSPGLSRKDIP